MPNISFMKSSNLKLLNTKYSNTNPPKAKQQLNNYNGPIFNQIRGIKKYPLPFFHLNPPRNYPVLFVNRPKTLIN